MAMAGWYGDPLGLHEKRFFNGTVWTARVMDREVEGTDSLGNAAPPAPFTPTVSGVSPQYVGAPQYGAAPQYGPAPQYVVAQQYVVVGAQQAGNGFAVAALVLGIVGVLFSGSFTYIVGGICAVLALVFGLLGRQRAADHGVSGGGMAIAGIVLGCVALALTIHSYWAWHRFANAIEHAVTTPTVVHDADPAANKVRVTSCDLTSTIPIATGTLVNTSGVRQQFRVTIEFLHVGTLPSRGTITTSDSQPGESVSWTVYDAGSRLRATSCRVVPTAGASP